MNNDMADLLDKLEAARETAEAERKRADALLVRCDTLECEGMAWKERAVKTVVRDAIEEHEAALCPEDMGCEEYIAILKARAEKAERERDEARALCRDHHLHACESCAATESERDELRAIKERSKSVADPDQVDESAAYLVSGSLLKELVKERDEARAERLSAIEELASERAALIGTRAFAARCVRALDYMRSAFALVLARRPCAYVDEALVAAYTVVTDPLALELLKEVMPTGKRDEHDPVHAVTWAAHTTNAEDQP